MTVVGAILLAAGLGAAVSQALGSALSDRFGRRPILVVAASLSVLLYAGLALSIGMSAPVWTIALVYIVSRSALTIIRPVISAMVADLTAREKLTEAYGILRTGANIGWAAGPAIGGFLIAFLTWGWLFAIAALICGIVALIVFLRVRESPHEVSTTVSFRSIFPAGNNPPFLAFLVLGLLLFVVAGQMGSTLSIFTVRMVGLSPTQYGLLLTLNGLLVVFFQYLTTLSLRRVAKFRALVLGSLLYGLGYLSLGWITTFGWAMGAMAVVTMGEMIVSPVMLSVVGELSPADQRGRYMGQFGLGQTVGTALGPLVGGVLLDVFPSDARFVWGPVALIAVITAVGYYYWARRFVLRAPQRTA